MHTPHKIYAGQGSKHLSLTHTEYTHTNIQHNIRTYDYDGPEANVFAISIISLSLLCLIFYHTQMHARTHSNTQHAPIAFKGLMYIMLYAGPGSKRLRQSPFLSLSHTHTNKRPPPIAVSPWSITCTLSSILPTPHSQ